MELAILLSTYNSESFIKAQLESLLSQTYKDWILYVRDDQSTDATPQILRQYADNDSRIHVMPDGEKEVLEMALCGSSKRLIQIFICSATTTMCGFPKKLKNLFP